MFTFLLEFCWPAPPLQIADAFVRHKQTQMSHTELSAIRHVTCIISLSAHWAWLIHGSAIVCIWLAVNTSILFLPFAPPFFLLPHTSYPFRLSSSSGLILFNYFSLPNCPIIFFDHITFPPFLVSCLSFPLLCLPPQLYEGLRLQDLRRLKDMLIVETADMLQAPLFTAEALLRAHGTIKLLLTQSHACKVSPCL